MTSIHFDSRALSWYKSFMKTKDRNIIVSWGKVVEALFARFGE